MGVDLLDQKFEWRCRDLVGRGWYFCMPGHRLKLCPMSKPGGALPARYIHCCICACLCSIAAGSALCYGERANLTWLGRMRLNVSTRVPTEAAKYFLAVGWTF